MHPPFSLLGFFKKDDITKVKIVSVGRLRYEMLAVGSNRVISIFNCFRSINDSVKVKIIRTKHNIIIAKIL